MTTTAQAAALLGIPISEVSAVVDLANGPKITTTDGVSYINVNSGLDAEGKSGLMYFTSPVAVYDGNFPVYTPAFGTVEPSDVDTTVPQDAPQVRGAP